MEREHNIYTVENEDKVPPLDLSFIDPDVSFPGTMAVFDKDVAKRRKANKVARRQRKVNRK